MARCGCGSVRCGLVRTCISAGPGIIYNPETGVVAAEEIDCSMVRGCVSAGDGLAYDEATGEFTARPSGDAGNDLVFGGDGGLYVPTASATVATGCGLSGDGSAAAPLGVSASPWPYECDAAVEGGVVACGADGVLRGEPPSTYWADQVMVDDVFPALVAPASYTTVATAEMTFTNPSPCKPALVLAEIEVDVDFDIPAGGSAMYRFSGDAMWTHTNTGGSMAFTEHVQTTKVVHGTLTPGETRVFGVPIDVAGTGGTTYDHVKHTLRVWIFAL